MDAVKFLEEWHRMCKLYSSGDVCIGCPMSTLNAYCAHNISMPVGDVVSIVEKWSAEYPRKTKLMDFWSHFPDAPEPNFSFPPISPRLLGYCKSQSCVECIHRGETWEKCWNLPVEE